MNSAQNINEALKDYKKYATAICRDLNYQEVMSDCIKRINSASTEYEIARIMHTCRDRLFN